MRNHIIGGLALILGAAVMPMTAEALNPTTVTCPGDSIQVAIDSGFDEITVNGTCTENVLIRQDDITIMGDGGDIIEGQVSIDGAQRIRVQELTITGGPEHGITAANGAVFTAVNLLIENVPGVGVIVTSNSTGEVNAVTIRGAGAGVVVEGSAKVVVNNGSLIEQIGGVGVIALGGAAAYLHQVTVREASEGVRATEHSYVEILFGSIIEDNGGIGVAVDLGSTGNVADATIQNNGDSGIVVANGSTALISVRDAATTSILGNAGNGVDVNQGSRATVTNSTIQSNGGFAGIAILNGSQAVVTNATIQDNGDDGSIGVLASYSSTAQLDGNTIVGKAEGVGLDFSSSVFLANNQITATTSDDATLDLSQGSVARLAGGNTLTASPNGFSIFLQQGSTLMQRSERDNANGPVWIRSESNVELRNIEIVGNVIVEDHSLLRLRDLTGDSHVTVRGNSTISLDSGLNFIGSFPVKVVGDISCLDQESSLGKGTLSLTGKIKPGCTGY